MTENTRTIEKKFYFLSTQKKTCYQQNCNKIKQNNRKK